MTIEKWFVRFGGCLALLAAGCAPQHGTEGPVGTAQSAVVDVTWFDVVGVSASGDSLTKTGAAGWNAGAASNETLTGDGYAQFTTGETTTDKMAGLSSADPAQSWAAIDFALYLSSGGGVNVYEDGALRGQVGVYAAGDVFLLQVAGKQVTYFQNGNLLYTSSQVPTLPLLFGTSLYSTGATVNSVVLSAASTWWTDAVGVTTSGESMTKLWNVPGWNAGAVSAASLAGDGYAQFTTAEASADKVAGLSHADPAQSWAAIDFALYLSSGGGVNVYEDGVLAGSFGAYVAGDVFVIQVAGKQVTYFQNGNLLYTSARSPKGSLLFGTSLYTPGATVNSVVLSAASTYWKDAVGVTTSGESMTKLRNAPGWNAGAASVARLAGDGYTEFTTAEASTDKMAGLSHADPAQSWAAIDFALYLSSGGGVNVYEDGVLAGSFGTYAAGDVFRIQVAGKQVTYLQNGSLLYTSTRTPAHHLLFGTSLYSPGATIGVVSLTASCPEQAGHHQQECGHVLR